jgi:hypothetical protein
MPRATGFPRFGCRRFSSGAEMNAWKKEFLAENARQGGVRWKKTFSLDDLIASKEAVGRPQDLADVEFLKIRKQS